MKRWAYLFIALSAVFWGIIGIFVQGLYQFGLSPIEVVAIRVMMATMILLPYVYFTDRSLLKINLKDSFYFVGTGIFSIVFFNWSYFTAIQEISLSLAAILLYTAPAFVTILSRIIFKEWFTKKKLVSLFLTFIGIMFVIGYLPNMESTQISTYGFLVGIGAGVGYSLYSIFGKAALKKYKPLTITTYTFVFASIVLVPTTRIWTSFNLMVSFKAFTYIIGLGLFPTALAYILYTKGLSYVESSRASITATIEPIVATLIGILQFGDYLSWHQLAGILMILISILLIQEGSIKKEQSN
ncbi:DMT family transporter [Tepidibacillus infernus]|uniref:DMT family transporter n=1 Tax=Tepidibacillus infernus TaxID=1806172 RepID=UPI003A40B8CD